MGPSGGLSDGGAKPCQTTLRFAKKSGSGGPGRQWARRWSGNGAGEKKIDPGFNSPDGAAGLEGGGEGAIVEIVEFAPIGTPRARR